MLLGDVPSPIVLFADEAQARDEAEGEHTGGVMTGDERAEMEAEREVGVEYITRASLLNRPPLEPVSGEPGHWVAPHSELAAAVA